MIDLAIVFAFVCFGGGLLMNLWRLFHASDIPDRVLALDTMVINMIALLVLYGIRQNTGINFEAALLFALTGFVSSVAYAKFMLRGNIIE